MPPEPTAQTIQPLGPIQRALLARLMSGALPRWLEPRVRARVRDDVKWRAAYNALRRAERASAGDVALSAGQLAFIERAAVPSQTPRASSLARVTTSLSAAAASAAVLLFAFGSPAPAPSRWQSRGGGTPAVGVKVRCLNEENGTPHIIDETVLGGSALGQPLTCQPDGLLAFSFTNLSASPAYAFVLGVRDDGEPLWFAPFAPDGQSLSMRAGAADAMQATVAELAQMQLGHAVTLHALLSERPLSGDEIAAALKRARQAGLNLARLDRLPVPAQAQARATLLPQANGAPQR